MFRRGLLGKFIRLVKEYTILTFQLFNQIESISNLKLNIFDKTLRTFVSLPLNI